MPYLIPLSLLLLLINPITSWADEEKVIRIPPQSLAQWYKPDNKRQVWLHTMFRLRREMQAVKEYAAQGDMAGVQKWGQRLVDDYRKIPEMVPEWDDEVELEWADHLEGAIQNADLEKVARATKKLGNSCNACHREYRPLVAALYRTPDYSKLTVAWGENTTLKFTEAMAQLSQLVNRIKIATEDGSQARALEALGQLQQGLGDLGTSCDRCHQDSQPKERILGAHTQELLEQLEVSIKEGEKKQTGRLLGKAAVVACARCHGVHRTLGNLKTFLEPPDQN